MPLTRATYCELQVTSNFSFLYGASHPEELIAQAALLNYKAIAITDRNTLAGIVRAHVAAKKHSISLIVGCHLEIDTSPFGYHDAHLSTSNGKLSILAYPTCKASYSSLSGILSLGKRRTLKGQCNLTLEDLLKYQKGLLLIIAPSSYKLDFLARILAELKSTFTEDRLALGISRLYQPNDTCTTAKAIELAKRFAVPIVATNDVCYHIKRRKLLHDVLTCIRLKTSVQKAGFALSSNAEHYLKPPQEMERLFSDIPKSLLQTQIIAERALNFSMDQLTYEYPVEICEEGKDPMQYLSELTWECGNTRYGNDIPASVKAQLEHELSLISELNYAKYFLTVYDIVVFARQRGILCQGRGAAANSAVCYCLGITSVDPSDIDILFERFISKERDEPPDIDIDFEHERREEVIQYIYNKYGRERAALVAEVITYRSKSAIRDVGKAMGLTDEQIGILRKTRFLWREQSITLRQLRDIGLDDNLPNITWAIELSRELIGFPRHLSQHVGGFIITNNALSEIVPIENASMPDRTVIEWNKDDIEAMGMLKIDILALGMLTCMRKALDLINCSLGTQFNLHNIPQCDKGVYDMICRADTIGVFQIESRAQMNMLPRLRPRCYYDLVIEVAIIRPGPIQGNMVHPYLRRRLGKERATYPSKQIERILSKTLGVPIFQEQVMRLAMVGAGFKPGEADELRRAMAAWKHKSNILDGFRERIISGMLANGYSIDFAKSYFEQIKGFGEYGFPESHAASFALLVYVSAWLKHHYPGPFCAALLNSQPMGFYQPAQIVDDAKRHGVTILPVDVNHSEWDCSLEGDIYSLRLGMRLVKGLRQAEAVTIAAVVRENGLYNSIAKLFYDSGVSIQCLKSLALADAFSSMNYTRQQALWEIRSLHPKHFLPLLDTLERGARATNLPFISLPQNVWQDYQATGLSLKAHPLSFFRKTLIADGIVCAIELKNALHFPRGKSVKVAGLVLTRQRPMTASGVVFVTLEDETSFANLIIRPHIFEQKRTVICESSMLLVAGKIERAGEVVHVIVDDAYRLAELYLPTPTPVQR